jgi:hypothetical protein
MKTSSKEEVNENHNLVMFPASKNFKPSWDTQTHDPIKDPLHDLLHEYSHVLEDDIPSYLDDRFEQELIEAELALDGDAFDSLDAFMNRHERGEILTPDDKLIKLINNRISAIKDAKARIKYYLDELEMFLPSRKK